MENEVRMIITDLDNSLLNSKRQISKYTINVFKKCVKNGIIIVFATARPYRKTQIFFNLIEPNAVICHCGGVVYINNKIISYNSIDSNIAKNIINSIVKEYSDINIGIECDDEIYTNFNTSIYWEDVPYKNIDLEYLPPKKIDKIILGLESINELEQIKKYIPNELYVEKMEEKIALIMNKNATKWNGIKKLIEYYGISEENTIAFGDDDVDIEMIEKCGIGIAMENGNTRIKNKAKYICKNNNEDGVAKWIEKNILENANQHITNG